MWDINCAEEKVKSMTKNFYELFGEDFPSLADKDCLLDEEELRHMHTRNLGAKYTRRCVTNV